MSIKTVEQIKQIFNAESVALVGATDKDGSFGRLFLEGMRDAGCRKLYPINPKREDILGIKAYSSISAVPDRLDLAILLIPPNAVMGLVKECVENKVGGAVVFASGFGELGTEGKALELEIGRVGREGGTRIIGPNCLGFFNPRAGIVTYPQTLMKDVPTEGGSIGGFSQSGSFVDYLVWFLSAKGVRFSSVVSCGNECDLAAEDFLEYLGQDDNTKTIVSYMEGVKDGRRFFETAREVSRKKPIILWKGGVSEQGARAAASHTGALAGSASIWNAMFKQAGIINVNSVEEVVDCAVAFHNLPLPKGRRIAIISGQGGTGVGTADNCWAMGLELPRLSEKTTSHLREVLPPVGTSVGNPTDTGVASLLDPDLYKKAIEIVADDEGIDMIMVILNPVPACLEKVAAVTKCIEKPLAVTVSALPELEPKMFATLAEKGVAAYSDPKRAVYVLSRMAEYASFLND
ncbi:MAG: CoA-binding protein [Deltaproteobacteria bacterium]|nr:CoA-binding protein [Deltaproteobacteria bacterium]